MMRQSTMKSLITVGILCLFSQSAFAKVTLQVNLGGELGVADGTVGVLVVDRSGDGFTSPAHASAVGTKLEAGEQIGLSDDIIIGVVQSSTSQFTGGRGFIGVLRGIDYDALQLTPGMATSFYWFPGVVTSGASVTDSTTFDTFRTINASNIASSISWQLPARRGVFNLAYLNGTNGGNIEISNPGANGTHSNGTAGTDDSVLPGGGGSEVDQSNDTGGAQTLVDVDWADAASGTYQGLLSGEGGRVNGEITVRVTRGRASVSGKVDGTVFRYSGSLILPAGDLGPIVVTRAGLPPITLTLNIRQDSVSDVYTFVGTVDNDGEVSTVEATQNGVQRAGGDHPGAGVYTFALPAPGSTTQTALPAGDGVGQIKVTTKGQLRATMILGDGTRATDTGYLSEDSIWHLFSDLYRREGFIAGRVSFRNTDNIADFDGPLHWFKPAEARPTTRSTYPLGFETSVNLIGSAFTDMGRSNPLVALFLEGGDASLDLIGGALDPAFAQKTLVWDGSKVTFPGAIAGEKLTVRFTARSGAVSGRYSLRYTGGDGRPKTQSISFSGVALQKQNLITGNFVGAENLTGLVKMESVGDPALIVQDSGSGNITNGANLDFGNVGEDGGTGEQVIVISNTGAAVLYLPSSPEISGPNASSFYLATQHPGKIQPGDAIAIRIGFNPDSEAGESATLNIISNDRLNNPFTLNLSGTGVAGSADNISPELGTAHVESAGAGAAPIATTGEIYDPATHAGRYKGILKESGGAESPVGEASFTVTDRRGVGAFSLVFRMGRTSVRATGSINADGTITAPSIARITAGYDLIGFQIQETAAGVVTYAGTVQNLESGESYSVEFAKNQFSRSNPAPSEGNYTMIIPANEALGAGYPSGDSVGYISVRSTGTSRATLVMGDGQRHTLTGFIDGEGRWAFFKSARTGQLGGSVIFRDVPNISDADGNVEWSRTASVNSALFPAGFSIEGTMLASRFALIRDLALLAMTQDGNPNASISLTEDIDPLTSAPGTQLGPFNVIWGNNNRPTHVPSADESIRLLVNTRNGTIRGSYFVRSTRTRYTLNSVVFQKQNISAGHFLGRELTGLVRMTTIGTPTIVVQDAASGSVASGATLDLGSVGEDGGTGERVIVISNTGQAVLYLSSSPEISGADSDTFYLASQHPGKVLPGQAMALRVGFNPDGVAAHSATLTINSNDRLNNPFVIQLTGAGVAGSDDNIEAALGAGHLAAPALPATPVATSAANYDSANHIGRYKGILEEDGGAESQVAEASLTVTDRLGAGSFSLSVRIGRKFIRGTGIINPDGTFAQPIANVTTGYDLTGFQIQETAGGVVTYSGALQNLDTGEVYNVEFARSGYTRTSPAAAEGAYTIVIPANEALGAGFPAGDSVGTLTVSADGIIRATALMADGQRHVLSGFLDGNDQWSFLKSVRTGQLGGSIVFRESVGISDADGAVLWTRTANLSSLLRDGFSIEGQMLGSRFTPVANAALLTLTQDGNPNAETTLSTDIAPLTGIPETQLGPFYIIWSNNNRPTHVPTADETIRLTVNPRTGGISGSYSVRTPRTNFRVNSVVFQKQNIAPGNYTSREEVGHLVIAPPAP
ncbi:MAG: hypothetical protein ACI8UO_003632 [Verrucomicrobiales bacterium]|jgi:hypothetical protein